MKTQYNRRSQPERTVMSLFKRKIKDQFNKPPQRDLQAFTITLTKPEADTAAQAASFAATLDRWLQRQGDMQKGNAQNPVAGAGTVAISCTEETMQRIERQFAGKILRVDPPAQHQRGTIYPPKVDPWDISKWSTPKA